MIHEIFPKQYNPDYKKRNIEENDYVLSYSGSGIFVICKDGNVRLPKLSDYMELFEINSEALKKDSYYMFEISKEYYYLIELSKDEKEKYPYYKNHIDAVNEKGENSAFYLRIHDFRELDPLHMVFAGATGYHIYNWKQSRIFCGKCGKRLVSSNTERALICNECGSMEFPKISPAVIVAIKNEDKLLLVRNKRGAYKKLSLVSGFVEIGESFEHAVHREVMEEVGLKVKNLRFYKDQPWGISGAHMIGYIAELDGDDKITIQESELSEAVWLDRKEIPSVRNRLSVGSEIISKFVSGEI